MISTDVCVVCEGGMRQVEAPRRVKAGRRSVRIVDTFMQCAECGEEYYLPGQMEESQRRASAALAAGTRALAPAEVRAVRERLGVTQVEFERLIGVGPKTVVRWERGTVRPNAATDRLLRLVRDVPGTAEYLAAEHGIRLPGVGPEVRGAWAVETVQVIQIEQHVDAPVSSGVNHATRHQSAPAMTRSQTVRRHLEEIANEHDVAPLTGV